MRISDWSSDVCSSDLVDGVFFQRLAVLLGTGIADFLAAAQGVDRGFHPRLVGAGTLERAADIALVIEAGQHEQFRSNVGVAALLRQLVGHVEQTAEVVAEDRKSTRLNSSH